MNVLTKLKRSWWVLFSLIIIINGFGFIYLGTRDKNSPWVLEGLMYEVPWFFGVIFSANDALLEKFIFIAMVMMFVSIVRSVWLAIKLADVYDNEDKYRVRPTVVVNQNQPQEKAGSSFKFACCLCLIVIFLMFAIIAML